MCILKVMPDETQGTPPGGHVYSSHTGRRPEVPFSFDGTLAYAVEHESLGAALTAAGILALRQTASGDERGLFCGMGICHECAVTIDGVPDLRACMTAVARGMVVEKSPAVSKATDIGVRVDFEDVSPDVLVVGAGAAGLSAAAAAADRGANVLLLDERSTPGGQYYKQVNRGLRVPAADLDEQQASGQALIQRAIAAGVNVRSGAEVWGAFSVDDVRATTRSGTSLRISARCIVLAPGAYERGLPMPGWTLPGYLTTGAAQTLLRAYRVLPGARILVSGNGPLNLQVAAELARAGATVVAVADLGRPRSLRNGLSSAALALYAPGVAIRGLRYMSELRRSGTKLLWGSAVIGAFGASRVESARVASIDSAGRPVPGSEREYEVDSVCAGFGLMPSVELARLLGCAISFDQHRRQLLTTSDAVGRTSVEGVWIAGDGGGVGGAPLAQAQGIRAGHSVADALNLPASGGARREAAAAKRSQGRNERIQRRVNRLYSAPHLTVELTEPDTVICRCESVSMGQITDALEAGVQHIGTIKRMTRAGMGKCQGRYCGALLAELQAARSGKTLDDRDFFAPRSPAKPVRIGDVARVEQEPPSSLRDDG